MSDDRPALPEGWVVAHHPEQGFIEASHHGEPWLISFDHTPHARFCVHAGETVPLAVLRAFLAECERVRGGGEG